MSFLKKIVKPAIAASVGYATGGPAGAFAAGTTTLKAQQDVAKIRKQQQALARESDMVAQYPTDIPNVGGQLSGLSNTTTKNAGTKRKCSECLYS